MLFDGSTYINWYNYKAQTHMKGASITTQFRFKGPQSKSWCFHSNKQVYKSQTCFFKGKKKISIKKSKRAEILLWPYIIHQQPLAK